MAAAPTSKGKNLIDDADDDSIAIGMDSHGYFVNIKNLRSKEIKPDTALFEWMDKVFRPSGPFSFRCAVAGRTAYFRGTQEQLQELLEEELLKAAIQWGVDDIHGPVSSLWKCDEGVLGCIAIIREGHPLPKHGPPSPRPKPTDEPKKARKSKKAKRPEGDPEH